ncbi:hypothetical protein [Streptomyces sp. NPDC051909]|uniref:hypothetical protein n=1 Tax=Streptomyces sp. NPDC051909 TaxID=3154944 RepID=UPI00344A183B
MTTSHADAHPQFAAALREFGLDHEVVWAAAGTPHSVFALDPKTLIAHAGGTLVDVRERSDQRSEERSA